MAIGSSDAKGRIFSIQRFSIHDGPGIRTTVFLKGCPLTCAWCHNPEGRARESEVWLVAGRCAGCGACLPVCPHPGPVNESGIPSIDAGACVRCGACVGACPTGARQTLGNLLSAAKLLDELERDRPFYEESGGGVTFSGGEPLQQPEFLLDCLRLCRARGLHAAVDTSGCVGRESLLAVARWTDLFLFDLKLVDDERHRRETGMAATPVIENLRALDAAGAEIWVRVPLIPGVNDDAANLDAVGQLVVGLERTCRVHLLPYHATGAPKLERLGRGRPEVPPPGLSGPGTSGPGTSRPGHPRTDTPAPEGQRPGEPVRGGNNGSPVFMAPDDATVVAAATRLRAFDIDVRIGG